MMTNIVGCEQTPEALELDMALTVTFEAVTDDITMPLFQPGRPNDRNDHGAGIVTSGRVAVVGAAETTELGVCPTCPDPIARRCRAQRDRDAGLTVADIDGFATAGERPTDVAHYLGHHPALGRRHLGRRLLVHDPRASRGRRDRRRGCARPC
jgi:hypothetical protein